MRMCILAVLRGVEMQGELSGLRHTEFSDGEPEDCEDRQGSRTIHKSANFVIGWVRCCHWK